MRYMIHYFLLCFTASAFGMGSPRFISPLDDMAESTASVNQMTQTSDAQGQQEEQWNQEEEDMDYTDEEKAIMEKQAEEDRVQQINDIEDYRYDVPIKKKILD